MWVLQPIEFILKYNLAGSLPMLGTLMGTKGQNTVLFKWILEERSLQLNTNISDLPYLSDTFAYNLT